MYMHVHNVTYTIVSIFSASDGTATGGKTIGSNVDYLTSNGTLHFEHGETSKNITIDVNKNVEGSKNFIVTLRNPSLGALIGQRSAAVCHFNRGLSRLNSHVLSCYCFGYLYNYNISIICQMLWSKSYLLVLYLQKRCRLRKAEWVLTGFW